MQVFDMLADPATVNDVVAEEHRIGTQQLQQSMQRLQQSMRQLQQSMRQSMRLHTLCLRKSTELVRFLLVLLVQKHLRYWYESTNTDRLSAADAVKLEAYWYKSTNTALLVQKYKY
jgi:hypothetical protein